MEIEQNYLSPECDVFEIQSNAELLQASPGGNDGGMEEGGEI